MSVIRPGMHDPLITRSDLLPLSFLMHSPYTGSKRGLRYRIERDVNAAGEDKLILYSWHGPLAYAATPGEEISRAEFEFSESGMEKIIEHLNRLPEESGAWS